MKNHPFGGMVFLCNLHLRANETLDEETFAGEPRVMF